MRQLVVASLSKHLKHIETWFKWPTFNIHQWPMLWEEAILLVKKNNMFSQESSAICAQNPRHVSHQEPPPAAKPAQPGDWQTWGVVAYPWLIAPLFCCSNTKRNLQKESRRLLNLPPGLDLDIWWYLPRFKNNSIHPFVWQKTPTLNREFP